MNQYILIILLLLASGCSFNRSGVFDLAGKKDLKKSAEVQNHSAQAKDETEETKRQVQIEAPTVDKALADFNDAVALIENADNDKSLFEKAAKKFNDVITRKPDFKEAHFNLGLAYYYLGLLDQSVEKFQFIVDNFSDPYYSSALYNLGTIYYLQGKYDMALDSLSLIKESDNIDLRLNKGVIYTIVEQTEKAETEFRAAVDIDPENPDGYFNLAILNMYKGKDFYRFAKGNFITVLLLEPDSVDTFFHLGVIYYLEGDMDNAASMFKKATELAPEFVDAHYNLGMSYYNIGNIKNAVTHFSIAKRYNHNESIRALTKIALDSGKTEDALLYTQELIHNNPEDFLGYFNLGIIHQKAENYNDAVIAYKKALKLSPDNVSILNNLAVVYRETGKFNLAIRTYRKILFVNPYYSLANRNLGIIYDVYLNDLKKAEYYYKNYKKIGADKNDNVDKWLEEIARRKKA